jgi:hypothetical protein
MDSPDTPSRRAPRTPQKERAMALAQERRQTILVRARRIRRGVAALTAMLFSVAFLVIYVQLASGHDPALVANAKRAATEKSSSDSGTSTTAAGATSSSTESSETKEPSETEESSEGKASSEDEESATGEESSGASAVTTSQS